MKGSLRFAVPPYEDVAQAANLAAAALLNSPPYRFAFGESADLQPEYRQRFLQFLFSKNFELARRHGFLRCAYENQELVCFLLLAPQGEGAPAPSFCDLLRSGLLGSIVRFGLRPTLAVLRITMWVEGIEQEILQGRPTLRVEGMGVLPSRQGVGIGSSMLQHALRQSDAEGFDVFLTTQDRRTVPFYERLGFEVVREEVYPPAGFCNWFMLRPSPAAASTPSVPRSSATISVDEPV